MSDDFGATYEAAREGRLLMSEPGIKDRTRDRSKQALATLQVLTRDTADTAVEPYDAPGGHPGTVPDPKSSRASWWPYEQAPAAVQAVADKLWPVRDSRVVWWVGCCGAYENPDGLPLFMHTLRMTRRGPYWWGLAFVKNGQTRYELLDECEAALLPHVDVL